MVEKISVFFEALEQADRDGVPANNVKTPAPEVSVERRAGDFCEDSPASEPTSAPTDVPTATVFRAPKIGQRIDQYLRRAGVRRRHEEVPLIADMAPTSPAAEAYRTLRANVEFGRDDRACRTITVTSTVGREGKSTTAMNFAIVSSQADTRVCLVDADLRVPVLHEVFGVPNTKGLTNLLSGDASLGAVVRETRFPNLSLIPAGPISLNPGELLASQRLQEVLEAAKEKYDLVVCDSPPVRSVSDAVMLAALCDGVIFVVRAGYIPAVVMRRATRQIEQVRGHILGVVLNRVNLRKADAEYYGYEYYRTKPAKPVS